MKVINTATALHLAECPAVKSRDTSKLERRTTDLTSFAMMLSVRLHSIHPKARLYRLESPSRRGDVTIVVQCPEWENLQAMTYRADGTWSDLSYWGEEQI